MSQYRSPEGLEVLQRECYDDPIGVSGRKCMQSYGDCDTKVKSKSLSQSTDDIEILRETCYERSVKKKSRAHHHFHFFVSTHLLILNNLSVADQSRERTP